MDLCCIDDFEEHAKKVLPKNALDYYRSGAASQLTLQLNIEAFQRLRIRPRVMRDVSNRSLSTSVLGHQVSLPVGVAPTAMQRMAHAQGELANARAAGKCGTIYVMSTLATSSLEEVAEAAPDTIRWFQLYIYKNRKLTAELVRRAERTGWKALVLTVDAPVFGVRYADARNKFKLPPHLRLANFEGMLADKITSAKKISGLNEYVNDLFDDTINWKDVSWLKSITKLPLVLKGVLTPEDALIAADLGIEAIVVSNHGARQLDTVPASIEVLPSIVSAVGGRMEVYLDGGIRQGTDVFKALALGAKMVFMGRPALWGLAHSGQKGVERVIDILRNEFDTALALTGCTSVKDIRKEMVVHESEYSKL
ncbi:hydroxyacid oxidase 1 isoform X2 [Nilaparvata lugens]|uniref:hydroxyacid oxidase 1 isoform X1 n=1 Tax=Nilaparvata lugens TaxID=108931 RepID=UPI00193D2792|nr:hydroxyacid oxidase 1 isoform X1 [Nilaparvata lugens]XP_039295579.1 hydroxyacid oxidase 1 isoform X2 [Nilaparvata lugens]